MTAAAVPQAVARRRAYGRDELRKDLVAGLTVAAVSLPQAMAYALIAGVDPRFGLYSAIVVTAIASIFGSSSHLINGPTNAISLVVFSALAIFDPEARYDAYQATFLLGIMVGSLQILIAVFRLGDLTRYISESVVLGFMAGAGLLVGLGQIGNLLGIPDKGTGHQLLVHRLWLTLTSHAPINVRALALGLGTIALVVGVRRLAVRYRLPRVDMLLALVAAALRLRSSRLVDPRRPWRVARHHDWPRACQPARPSHPGDQVRLGEGSLGQRPGDRGAGAAGGAGDLQVDRPRDAPDARLQPPVPGRGSGQPGGRFFPVPARLRLADPLGDQLPGRRRQPCVRGWSPPARWRWS